jgi:hypothetical protein
MRLLGPASIAGGLAVLAAAGAFAAAHAEEHAPPPWSVLVKCAEKGDDVEELACYRAAMKAAGYAQTTESAAVRRRRFGLSLPAVTLLRHHDKEQAAEAAAPPQAQAGASEPAAPPQAVASAKREKPPKPAKPPKAGKGEPAEEGEAENRITVQLAQVALIPPANKLLLVTTDGAVWEQLDSDPVNPRPKPGSSMTVRRTGFGGYFCRFDKNNSVRCQQTH